MDNCVADFCEVRFTMENDTVDCPICSKSFSTSAIEAHASSCLFLNERSTTDNQNFLKRPRPGGQLKVRSPTVSNNKKVKRTNNASGSQMVLKSPTTVQEKTNLFNKEPNKSSFVLKDSKKLNSWTRETPETTPSTSSVANNAINVTNKNEQTTEKKSYAPLAEKMRPTTLLDYVGQSHVLGKKSMLMQLFEKNEIPNIILWGPPGCGKTSLANVIANICKKCPGGKLRYVKLSAAMVGVAEVKEATKIAANDLKFGRKTVIFMDEIHRFNKAQQDIFLPHVESGTITLIGATTENPSFSLNSALLSRCRVIVLEKLSVDNLMDILSRGVKSLRGVIYKDPIDLNTNQEQVPLFLIDQSTIEFLAETCDGDARIALGGLELAIQSSVSSDDEFSLRGPTSITLDDIKEGLKKTHMLYDRKGDQHYDMISALHKSVRASDANASLYWLARMMAGGEDPVYIARRMVRMACEDIGLEDPKALGIAVHTMHACKMIGMPECDVMLAQCAVYLANAPKSRLMEDAIRAAQKLIAEHKGPQPGVPLHLRNAPTRLMKELNYGKGYNILHHSVSGLSYLPEGLENVDFFDGQNPVESP